MQNVLRAFIVAAAVSLLAINSSSGQVSTVKEQPAWLEATLKTWTDQDASAAFAQLEESGAPGEVAQRYAALAQYLYNDRKDLTGLILASRAGIQFNLNRASALDATDERAAAEHRGHAKAIAYNLGANCWPGWMDQGISITATERAIGLDAARLNLRLAVELNRPAEPRGHAHWLLGAQLLAAGQFDAAAAQFTDSARHFAEAEKPTERQMALAYESLTRRIHQPGDAARQKALMQSLAALEALDNDDARFFAEQIRTAEKVFAK
jgi:hypothetical protein